MSALFAAGPVWLWLLIAAVVGGLLVLAWPAVVDAAWEFFWWAGRLCMAVGVLVVAGLILWVLLLVTGVVGSPDQS